MLHLLEEIKEYIRVLEEDIPKVSLAKFIKKINEFYQETLITEQDISQFKDLYRTSINQAIDKFNKIKDTPFLQKYFHTYNIIRNIKKIYQLDNSSFYVPEFKDTIINYLNTELVTNIKNHNLSYNLSEKDKDNKYIKYIITELIFDDSLTDSFEEILGKKTLDNILKVIINNEIPLRDILSSYPYFYGSPQILQSALKEDQGYITKIQGKTQEYLKNFIGKNIQDIPYNALNLLFSKMSDLFKEAKSKVIKDQEINKKYQAEVRHYIKEKYERLEQQSIYINGLLEFVVKNKSNLLFEDKAELLVKYYNFEEYCAKNESIILKEYRLKILFEITNSNKDISNLYCIMKANSFKFSQQVKYHYKDLDILEKRIFTAYEKSWSTTVLNKDYKVTPEKKEL